ncbi:DUF3224 domain-containing protein [Streptomyces bambusae]|uniref:DUF3224 domain-containing protein n=1 Tax=Streptomyces bambusae TaxID=1550616 RepID=UPI001CFF0F2A|nr:DUF3224 domain-containing protein [Streptomyces bambusae]MCB5165052.1 DUF3224 domain-containing protein [Streptomyces bambusae]
MTSAQTTARTTARTTTTTTTGRFRFADWKEQPLSPAGTLPRLAGASVRNTFSGGIEAADTHCAYTVAYLGETDGTFAGMELLTGTLDGRTGTFVLAENGTFDAQGTHCTLEVVPGSGTGELTGLRGTGRFFSPHSPESVEYTFTYELPEA